MKSSVNIRLFRNCSVLIRMSSLGWSYMIPISNIRNWGNMKYEIYCVFFWLINSLEGLGMLFSSAALIRRLRGYAATIILAVVLPRNRKPRWKKHFFQVLNVTKHFLNAFGGSILFHPCLFMSAAVMSFNFLQWIF